MDRILSDVRFALRALIKSPLVTGAAIASLALGIGANAAIFSAVDTFMIRPLQFEEADNLIVVWTSNEERGWTSASSSAPDYLDWRTESRTADLAAHSGAGLNLSGLDRPERLRALRITSNFFDVLRKRPALGRIFRPEEERASAARAAILSDGLWQRRFGADPAIVGQVINLDGEPHEVVGVMPPKIGFGSDPDVWIPLRFTGEEARNARFLQVLGRLRAGATLDDVRSEMGAIQSRLSAAFPAENAGNGANIVRLQEEWFDEGFRQGSLISGTAVLLVLLIACGNVANLLLARGATRAKEMALRMAIGAGRATLLRQLLTESVILALGGGLLAVPIAVLGIRGIQGLFPPGVPGTATIVLSGRVLIFMAAISIASGIAFGLVPALRLSRTNLRELLTDGGRGNTGVRGGRLRTGLVIAEIALSFVLLVSSVLLVKAFVQLRTADLGFQLDDRVTMGIALTGSRFPDRTSLQEFQRQLLDRLEGVPGAIAIGASNVLPMRGNTSRLYTIPDEPPPEAGREPSVSVRFVTPGYLEAMNIASTAGRSFAKSDVQDAPPVAVINARMAARHWPDASPIGSTIRIGGVDHEVIGVVGDTRDFGPDDDPVALVYMPMLQSEVRNLNLIVHTTEAPAAVANTIREAVRSLDPEQPVHDVNTLRAILEDDVSGSLAMTKVLGALGLVAFILAAVGVYGVMAYSVAQRRQELGIRMALGAQRGNVLGLVFRRGILITGGGIGIGLLLALGVTRLLSFFLFGVSPFDPVAFISVPLILGMTGMVASALPALRASRVDPLIALRAE